MVLRDCPDNKGMKRSYKEVVLTDSPDNKVGREVIKRWFYSR